MISIPKPTKASRPGEIRRRFIEREWERVRDERRRELQDKDGHWTCFYCGELIYNENECVMAHIEPKGRQPAKKLLKENLAPSHAQCNVTDSPHYRP